MMLRTQGPSLRALVAIFAILVNAALSAGLNTSVAGPNPLGAPYAVCLAGIGAIDEAPPGEQPASADALHCQLCLLRGPTTATLTGAVPSALPQPAVARVNYEPLCFSPPASPAGNAFDARAPPVLPA